MMRWALGIAALLAVGSVLANPPHMDRSIGKQPAYKTAPKYGLLVFGPEGKDCVWLVRDGDILYVDRNGNGDLTEPGEKVVAKKRPGHDPEEEGYTFEVGDLNVGGRIHKGLNVSFIPLQDHFSLKDRADVKAALAKDPKAMTSVIIVDAQVPGITGGGVGGRVAFLVGMHDLTGVLQFAENPSQAPVIRLGGPLQVTFYGGRPTLRSGRSSDFILVVGTPGIGPGTFAYLDYKDTIPLSARPVAEIEYQPAKPGDPPHKDLSEIKQRC
jgi:hypothetical protein